MTTLDLINAYNKIKNDNQEYYTREDLKKLGLGSLGRTITYDKMEEITIPFKTKKYYIDRKRLEIIVDSELEIRLIDMEEKIAQGAEWLLEQAQQIEEALA